ncbi:hypothetical protein ACIGW7_37870 [Streptomyces sp. NPDC053253]|uniref:hypothetical protein n=1 Tax=Streptomyces sp. NPDC053253 TaxID=3365699 RepID=UPI0037D5BC84
MVELQAALSTWLHFTKDTGQPAPHGDGLTSPLPSGARDGGQLTDTSVRETANETAAATEPSLPCRTCCPWSWPSSRS